MQVKVPKQGAPQSPCSGWEHRRACVQSGSTTEPVFRVGASQSLCSGWEHRGTYVQSLVGFPLGFFIPLLPAQADLDR